MSNRCSQMKIIWKWMKKRECNVERIFNVWNSKLNCEHVWFDCKGVFNLDSFSLRKWRIELHLLWKCTYTQFWCGKWVTYECKTFCDCCLAIKLWVGNVIFAVDLPIGKIGFETVKVMAHTVYTDSCQPVNQYHKIEIFGRSPLLRCCCYRTAEKWKRFNREYINIYINLFA